VEFKCKYFVFQPFEDRVINHNISDFQHIDTIEVLLSIPAGDGVSVDQLKSSIAKMRIVVSANWMPLWQFDMDNKDIAETQKQNDRWMIVLKKHNVTDLTGITEKYESLFAEKDGVSTNSK
jgi:hypothetical protein